MTMPYVSRDIEGNISAVSMAANAACTEQLASSDTELIAYIQSLGLSNVNVTADSDEAALLRSDLDLVRVMEDLINVLVKKNVICFTDLPDIAQQKINRRRGIRSNIRKADSLIDDDQGLI